MDKMAAIRRSFHQRGMLRGTTTSYTEEILAGGEIEAPMGEATEEDDEDEIGPDPGPKSLSSITLAVRPRMYIISLQYYSYVFS